MSAQVQNSPGADAHYQLINRVINYPMVNNAWESAKGYYTAAKSSSDLAKKSLETVEYRLNESVKWITPKVEPVLPYAEPLLNTVDGFGCRQLDRIEKINEAYHTSKQLLETRVTELKNSTLAAAEAGKHTIEDRVVPGVDQYLKDSYLLGTPVNIALNVTEKVADRFLPPLPQEEPEQQQNNQEPSKKNKRRNRHRKQQQDASSSHNEEDEQHHDQTVSLYTYDGPIYRATNISKRLQLSLRNLQLRPQEKLNAMQYCVDLIQYASENFDKTIQASNQFISEHIPFKNFSEVSEKVSTTAADAYKALHAATEVLVQHVPEGIQNLPRNFQVNIQELKSRKELQAFVDVCNKNIHRLQKVNNLLNDYIKTNDNIPQQLTIVTQKISRILESLTIDVDEKASNKKNE